MAEKEKITMAEKEIKITLVPKEQINERRDCVRITCGDIIAWGYTLSEAIEEFDEALKNKDMFQV